MPKSSGTIQLNYVISPKVKLTSKQDDIPLAYMVAAEEIIEKAEQSGILFPTKGVIIEYDNSKSNFARSNKYFNPARIEVKYKFNSDGTRTLINYKIRVATKDSTSFRLKEYMAHELSHMDHIIRFPKSLDWSAGKQERYANLGMKSLMGFMPFSTVVKIGKQINAESKSK